LAAKFNDYFSGIAQELKDKIPPSNNSFESYLNPSVLGSSVVLPASPTEIIALSRTLKPTHSPGHDDLRPDIINPIIDVIAEPLAALINCSLTSGSVPLSLKIAKVTPIFKQGQKDSIVNFRPITILPYFSKLFEKIMYTRLYDYILKKNILYISQHGFQPGHSTTMSLLHIQDSISAVIDRNEFSIGVFIDVAKAFDTIDFGILFKKLENIGIRGTALNWFKSYFEDRKQQVICNGTLSQLRLIKYGVPQGSILGPLLFLIYINDLPNASALLQFALFADDTNIFISNKSYNDLFYLMNQELAKVTDWFYANKLSLNLNKTNYILFCSHRKKMPIITNQLLINGIPIPRATSVKFLGTYLDQYLTWNEHIKLISQKVAKNVGIMARIAYLLPNQTRLNLYYSLIHPYLTYSNMVWASTYSSRLTRLSKLQRRAMRVIAGPRHCLLTDEIFKLCRVPNIEQIRILQTSEFMFKYFHNKLPRVFNNYFTTISTLNPYPVRSAANVRVAFARTNSRMFSIKCAGPRTWNDIPLIIRNLANISLFKARLRSHLIAAIV